MINSRPHSALLLAILYGLIVSGILYAGSYLLVRGYWPDYVMSLRLQTVPFIATGIATAVQAYYWCAYTKRVPIYRLFLIFICLCLLGYGLQAGYTSLVPSTYPTSPQIALDSPLTLLFLPVYAGAGLFYIFLEYFIFTVSQRILEKSFANSASSR